MYLVSSLAPYFTQLHAESKMNTQHAPNACNNWFWQAIQPIKLASWLFLGDKNKVENYQTEPRPSVSLILCQNKLCI